jgi:predicted nucleotidyltransferase component of viral defense system
MKLHYKTISEKAHEILKFLMQCESLKDFHLVGGTALSLQWGHRISEDIDMFRFTEEEVDGTLIFDEVSTFSGKINELGRKNYYLKLLIDNVKIDLLRYKHPLIAPILEIDGIRMLSPMDIAPMKLLAISNRGAKKDFYDLFFMFQQFSLEEMYGFYEKKFGSVDPFQIHRSLCFFEDADTRLDKLEPIANINWEQAKEEIKRLAKCI